MSALTMWSARRPPSAWSFRFGLTALAAASLAACGGDSGSPLRASPGLTTAVKFVQVAYATPQVNSASVTVKFLAAQTAGNLNVVAVGWNDTTATVTSVTDAGGNTYTRAVGPTMYPGSLTQSLYYAKDIATAAARANSVTVTFNVAAAWADIRILEYAGLDTAAPLDATAAASGSTNTSDSGPLTTTGPKELLLAANMTTGYTSGPGAGFTSRVVTSPDGDIAEDKIAASAGTYHGTAPASGVWVMQMAAFRSALQQPPTPPQDLTATAASSNEIDLGWTASTSSLGIAGYLVERCQGAECTSFAQIATPAGTTFADTSCAPDTSYSYRVRAMDTAGNLSAYSDVDDATTPPDTQPPAIPADLVAASASSSEIDLSWTASTDDVAVTGYLLERCQGDGCTSFAQVATPIGTSYSDTGLVASTSYSYRVRAMDETGNLSDYSTPASATTPAVNQPPTPPTNLVATAVSTSRINLTWTASTSSVGVAGYLVERCQGAGCTSFAQIATPTRNSYSDTGLLATTPYTYRVRAADAAGNLSGYSNSASDTTFTPLPSTPTLVQHLSSSADPEGFGETGNSFKFTLPNAVGAGNCLILGISYDWTARRTFSVTDNNGNTWPAAVVSANYATAGHVAAGIYVLPNANAGVTTITVTFDTNIKGFQYTVSEFNNIATASPVDVVTSGNPTAPTLAAASFTPTVDGDLIWYYATNNGDSFGNPVTQFTAGKDFTLLDADIAWGQGTGQAGQPHASQYFVQTTAATITPSMRAAQPANDGFLVVVVALKAASAGTAAPTDKIRVSRISHLTTDVPATSYALQFPSSGNLVVLTCNEPSGINITGITDNKGNTWRSVIPDVDIPQVWYAASATTGPDLKLTININLAGVATFTILLYDVGNADPSPYDGTSSSLGGGTAGAATISDQPVFTPASTPGLTIVAMKLGTGPSSGLGTGSPAGAFFDFVYYLNQTDGSKMDNSDGRAHFYNTDFAQEHFNWNVLNGGPAPTNGGVDSSYSSIAVHFKAAPSAASSALDDRFVYFTSGW